MSTPSGVSRRLEQCVTHLQNNDFEGALVNLFPAIDKTAKKRRLKARVAERIKAFLVEEEALISAVATGSVYSNISVDGTTITDALYKFGRTTIAHEGELDPRLEFNVSGSIEVGAERWNLPSQCIFGMCVAVIVAPENAGERVADSLQLTLFGQSFKVNELWAQRALVRSIICKRFNDPDLFRSASA
jgi:hypothetical protein